MPGEESAQDIVRSNPPLDQLENGEITPGTAGVKFTRRGQKHEVGHQYGILETCSRKSCKCKINEMLAPNKGIPTWPKVISISSSIATTVAPRGKAHDGVVRLIRVHHKGSAEDGFRMLDLPVRSC